MFRMSPRVGQSKTQLEGRLVAGAGPHSQKEVSPRRPHKKRARTERIVYQRIVMGKTRKEAKFFPRRP